MSRIWSKDTTREEDIPDRLKLGRLKNAQIEIEIKIRIADLPKLANIPGAPYTFWKNVDAAINDDVSKVAWRKVEEATIRECIGEHGQSPEAITETLCACSPGAASIKKREAIHALVEKLAPHLQIQYEQSHKEPPDSGMSPK